MAVGLGLEKPSLIFAWGLNCHKMQQILGIVFVYGDFAHGHCPNRSISQSNNYHLVIKHGWLENPLGGYILWGYHGI